MQKTNFFAKICKNYKCEIFFICLIIIKDARHLEFYSNFNVTKSTEISKKKLELFFVDSNLLPTEINGFNQSTIDKELTTTSFNWLDN